MKKSEMGAIVTFLGVVRDEGIKGVWKWKCMRSWRSKNWRNGCEKHRKSLTSNLWK